jgi:hypothetical protein
MDREKIERLKKFGMFATIIAVIVIMFFVGFFRFMSYQADRPVYTVNVTVPVPDGKFTYYTVSGALREEFIYSCSSDIHFTGVGFLVFTPYADNGGQSMEKIVNIRYNIYLEVSPNTFQKTTQDKTFVIGGT